MEIGIIKMQNKNPKDNVFWRIYSIVGHFINRYYLLTFIPNYLNVLDSCIFVLFNPFKFINITLNEEEIDIKFPKLKNYRTMFTTIFKYFSIIPKELVKCILHKVVFIYINRLKIQLFILVGSIILPTYIRNDLKVI